MTGLELLAAAAVGYLTRKARRVGRRAAVEVDQILDAGMDALDDLVDRTLGRDTALVTLRRQAELGEVSDRTQRRVIDAIAEVAETAPDFATALRAAVTDLQEREKALGLTAGDGGIVAAGDITMHAETGGVVAGQISGNVSTGGPVGPSGGTPPDPTRPDPIRG